MNFNSSIKMGGRFSLGEVNPLSGERISQTPWLDNQMVNAASNYLYTGFPDEGKVFAVGSDSTPVDPEQTSVLDALAMELISETIDPDCTVEFVRAVDNVEEIHVKGSSIFRIKLLADGVINEVAIENFCRALVIDETSGLPGLPVFTNMLLDITYEFTLIYRVTRQNTLILEGSAETTDGIDHFTDNSIAFIGSPVRPLHPPLHQWDKLLSEDTLFQIAHEIHDVPYEFDPRFAITADNTNIGTTSRSGTFVNPALPAIRSFYFGNRSYGVNYVMIETVNSNSIGLVLGSGDQLAFTTTLQWLNA